MQDVVLVPESGRIERRRRKILFGDFHMLEMGTWKYGMA
jgi:hypothetical protein